MIVTKAVKMANMMHIPVLGFVENYSYLQCPDCGKKINVFGKSHLDMIVTKAVKMANMMHIPVLGFVENYSYLQCPDCGKKINVFGKSHLDEIAKEFDLPILARLPIDPAVAEAYDGGQMETLNTQVMEEAIQAILKA